MDLNWIEFNWILCLKFKSLSLRRGWMEHFLSLETINSSTQTWPVLLLMSPDRTPHYVFPLPLFRELIAYETHSCGWGLLGNIPVDYKVAFSRPFLSYASKVPNIVGWYTDPFVPWSAFLSIPGGGSLETVWSRILGSSRLLLRGTHRSLETVWPRILDS